MQSHSRVRRKLLLAAREVAWMICSAVGIGGFVARIGSWWDNLDADDNDDDDADGESGG